MRLKQVLNLASWQQRNLSVGYGTRDKTVLKKTKKGKLYYLVKTYDKDIGELRSEVCASSIGRLFGFAVQRTWLCHVPQHKVLGLSHSQGVVIQLDVRRQKDTRRGQFREDLRHGTTILASVDKNFARFKTEKERRTNYSLDLVIRSLRHYVNKHPLASILWEHFFELLAFDSLIGGTDRHYNNWGILEKADDGSFLRLAPAFDNGISLLWKMEDHGPRFVQDLLIQNFPKRARSMFKKSEAGKYSLYEVLESLYREGDYRKSDIVSRLLSRIENVKSSMIRNVIFKNVPQRKGFCTTKKELDLVCLYAKIRLELLKATLRRLQGV